MCEEREHVLMFWISLHELKQIKTDFPLECNNHVSSKFDFPLGKFAPFRVKGCTCYIKLFEYRSHSFVMLFLCFSMDKHVILDRNMAIQSFQDLSHFLLIMFRSRLDAKGHSVKQKLPKYVMNVVSKRESGSNFSGQNPQLQSSLVKYLDPLV